MPNKNDKTPVAPQPIQDIQLDRVTGGCGACGDPNHKPTQQQLLEQFRRR